MINMMVSNALTPQSKTHPEAEWISTCSDIAFKVPDLWRKMEKENKDAPGKKGMYCMYMYMIYRRERYIQI